MLFHKTIENLTQIVLTNEVTLKYFVDFLEVK